MKKGEGAARGRYICLAQSGLLMLLSLLPTYMSVLLQRKQPEKAMQGTRECLWRHEWTWRCVYVPCFAFEGETYIAASPQYAAPFPFCFSLHRSLSSREGVATQWLCCVCVRDSESEKRLTATFGQSAVEASELLDPSLPQPLSLDSHLYYCPWYLA